MTIVFLNKRGLWPLKTCITWGILTESNHWGGHRLTLLVLSCWGFSSCLSVKSFFIYLGGSQLYFQSFLMSVTKHGRTTALHEPTCPHTPSPSRSHAQVSDPHAFLHPGCGQPTPGVCCAWRYLPRTCCTGKWQGKVNSAPPCVCLCRVQIGRSQLFFNSCQKWGLKSPLLSFYCACLVKTMFS